MAAGPRRGVVTAALAALVLFPAPPADGRLPPSFPFAPPDELRAPKARDRLPRLWADGGSCSTGCYPPGALPGWPIKPFHRPHLLNAGLNERRPGNLHSGIDVLARDGTPVYAVQPGRARVLEATGPDARVQIGQFVYWHVRPRVREAQYVLAYGEVVGTVLEGAGHLHLSELSGDDRYLNSLRPGGRVLSPWRDTAAPVLAHPRFLPRRRVLIRGFDPQSARRRGSSTPVLGLAGLAYRLFDSRGRVWGRCTGPCGGRGTCPTTGAGPSTPAGRTPLTRRAPRAAVGPVGRIGSTGSPVDWPRAWMSEAGASTR